MIAVLSCAVAYRYVATHSEESPPMFGGTRITITITTLGRKSFQGDGEKCLSFTSLVVCAFYFILFLAEIALQQQYSCLPHPETMGENVERCQFMDDFSS